jgi:predicted dehydrogenase
MAKTAAALVGAGFIGPVHAEGLKRLNVPITGILGVSDEESRQAASALGLPRAYGSYSEVLADPKVQVVHIATPNRLHFQMAAEALRAGKHVICEKPLAMTSEESAELVRLARQRPELAAAVNYNIRFYPLCIEARERVARGDIGQVFTVFGSYVQDWLLFPTDYNWRVLAEQGGELRAIADIGTHWMDLVQTITGNQIIKVLADLKTIHPVRNRPKGEVQTFSGKQEHRKIETEPIDINTEDCGCVVFHLDNGAQGCLWVSQATAGRKNRLSFELAGSRSALSWASEQPNELWIGHRDRPNELLMRDPALVSPEARRYISYPGGHNEGFADTFKQCFRSFYDYIEAGDFSARPGFPTFVEGHREILLCEAILQSHREQHWVEVER